MAITAVFGGTFNPLHIGHYQMIAALQASPLIDEIIIIPDKIPPHKVCDVLADDEDRIAMCKLAASDFSKAKVSLIEFEREGKSYTYDTVCLLKQKYKDKWLAFVCGGDMIVSLDEWANFEKLIKQISFIVFRRADTEDSLFYDKINQLIALGAEITVFEEDIECISSTEIRKDLKANKNLLPEKIYEYIEQKGLYRPK